MSSIAKFSVVPVLFVMAACGGGGAGSSESSGVKVVATTTIVGDLVRTIGGPEVEVEVLMGPGIDPHLYKPTAGDVQRVAQAYLRPQNRTTGWYLAQNGR